MILLGMGVGILIGYFLTELYHRYDRPQIEDESPPAYQEGRHKKLVYDPQLFSLIETDDD